MKMISYAFNSSADLDLRVPSGAQITVERVSGDANLRDISGPLQIQRVGGDLSLKNVNTVEIMSVGGDCATAAHQWGAIRPTHRWRFLRGRPDGTGQSGRCRRRCRISVGRGRCAGALPVAISMPLCSAQPVRIFAWMRGEMCSSACQTRLESHLDLRSRGRDIAIHYGGKSQNIEKRQYQATFGDGSTHISIDAGGDIRISDNPAEKPDYEDLVEEIDEHWSEVEESRSSRTEEPFSGFPFRTKEFNEHINRR